MKATNGDLYLQAKGTLDYGGEAPSGILRIKDGETAFDPDYFFDLTNALGGIAYGIYYFGDDLSFTTHNSNIDDFWEVDGGPYNEYVRINLSTQTAEKIASIPVAFRDNGLLVKQFNEGELTFTAGTGEENAAYAYDIATGNVTKRFVSTGGSISGLEKLSE